MLNQTSGHFAAQWSWHKIKYHTVLLSNKFQGSDFSIHAVPHYLALSQVASESEYFAQFKENDIIPHWWWV